MLCVVVFFGGGQHALLIHDTRCSQSAASLCCFRVCTLVRRVKGNKSPWLEINNNNKCKIQNHINSVFSEVHSVVIFNEIGKVPL